MLQPEGPVDAYVLATAEYFVTLRLGTLNTAVVAEYSPPRTVAWEEINDEVSPLLLRLDADARKLLFRGKRPRVRRPVVVAEKAHPRTIAERRSLPEHPLVSMRVLLPKNP